MSSSTQGLGTDVPAYVGDHNLKNQDSSPGETQSALASTPGPVMRDGTSSLSEAEITQSPLPRED